MCTNECVKRSSCVECVKRCLYDVWSISVAKVSSVSNARVSIVRVARVPSVRDANN